MPRITWTQQQGHNDSKSSNNERKLLNCKSGCGLQQQQTVCVYLCFPTFPINIRMPLKLKCVQKIHEQSKVAHSTPYIYMCVWIKPQKAKQTYKQRTFLLEYEQYTSVFAIIYSNKAPRWLPVNERSLSVAVLVSTVSWRKTTVRWG